MRLLEFAPPNIGAMRKDELVAATLAKVDELIALFTRPAPGSIGVEGAASCGPKVGSAESGSRAVVFSGDLNEVNDYFREQIWSDGLPIVPPTLAEVEAFLSFIDRSPDEVIGILPPTRLPATVWKVAVNGVMAGCRPEYMPVLVAIAEAISVPRFGIENVGSTVGLTPLIILNGPIIKELGFNSGQGVLRPQAQANITVSRFLRLLKWKSRSNLPSPK